jgi:hypothetical protein
MHTANMVYSFNAFFLTIGCRTNTGGAPASFVSLQVLAGIYISSEKRIVIAFSSALSKTDGLRCSADQQSQAWTHRLDVSACKGINQMNLQHLQKLAEGGVLSGLLVVATLQPAPQLSSKLPP